MSSSQSTPEIRLAADEIRADFRSDTVTRATPEMREAMASAVVGDDVYGEDPTVADLQDRLAEITNKEAGLFMTSGTQSNLAAVLSHCQRGDEYLVGRNSHIILNEAGGTAALGGAIPWPLEVNEIGAFSPEDVHAGVKEPDQHHPVTKLLCLENTCNGHSHSVNHIAACAVAAREHELAVHLDGARLFNSAIAEGVDINAFASHADTVSLCMSKGLGAPSGTVLVGDQTFIDRAFRLRKMLGGGMRQVGHLAAAAMFALDNHVERLADDHVRIARIADELTHIEGLDVVPATNMLWVTPAAELHDSLVGHLVEQGVLACFWKPTMRFVTHLDINDEAADLLVQSVQDFFTRA